MSFSKQQVSFFLNFASHFNVMKANSSLIFLVQTIYNLLKRSSLKWKSSRLFECSGQNLSNSTCQSWNDKSISLQIWYLSSVSWKITPLYFFSSNKIYFAQKELIKMKIFETFKCLGQNLSNSSCQRWHDKLVPVQILCNYSLPWQITPPWILSSCFSKFGLKDPIKIPILSGLEKICHISHIIFQTTGQLKVMLDKSVNNVLGEGM